MRPERPRPIHPSDATSEFHCGNSSLDSYLERRALPNHLSDLARCYVCTNGETNNVLGYYTLSAVAIERARMPGRVRRNAPDPIPAVLLARLAVDERAQGRGLGRLLVRDALLSTLAAADHIGARVLLVHALDDAAADFYVRLGFAAAPTDAHHLYVLLADARASL